VVARERRVVTPDGRVWFVRRRWAKRPPPWARRSRRPVTRVDADEELPAEEPVEPPLWAILEHAFDRLHGNRYAGQMVLIVLLAGVAVTGLLTAVLAAATVDHVLPWLLPFVAANARRILGIAATATILAAMLVVADRLQRPWFVELQRQGLSDAPRRVWRVRGWRRSERLMDEIAAAVREGRIDSEHAAILFRAMVPLEATAAATQEEQHQ
jgi:hypothetical protein